MSKQSSELAHAISSSFKRYISESEASEFYLHNAEAHILLKLIGLIGSESEALLVSTDPYDEYSVAAMNFGNVAKLICNMMTHSFDVRVFGPSWAVGLSSYSTQNEGDHDIPLDELEIKISLVGNATSWFQHP
jgi:hypothetical protein